MVVNLYVDNPSDTTVSILETLDTYIIDAAADTTYTYNLPSVSSDGKKYTLIRIDGTTGIVNLSGTMSINGTSISTFKVLPVSTVILISLDGAWNVVCSETTSPDGTRIVANAYFNTDINTHYISYPSTSSLITYFPFLGTNNRSTMSRMVVVFATPTTGSNVISVANNSPSVTIFSFTVTAGLSFFAYNLTPVNKNNLPSTPSIIRVTKNAGVALNISSISIYA